MKRDYIERIVKKFQRIFPHYSKFSPELSYNAIRERKFLRICGFLSHKLYNRVHSIRSK